MEPYEKNRLTLVKELVDYFIKEGLQVISAKELMGYRPPVSVPNDGYGDQEPKRPDVLAFDKEKKCFAIGVVRMEKNEIDSEESLTEYNVFLDQKDKATGQPYHLFIMVPGSYVNDLTSLLTHYIHRDYWSRITIVSSARPST